MSDFSCTGRADLARRNAPGAQRTAASTMEIPGFKLTPQRQRALLRIDAHGHPMSTTRAEVNSAVAKSLIKAGLVDLRFDGANTPWVRLTPKGTALARSIIANDDIRHRIKIFDSDARGDVLAGTATPADIKPMRRQIMADLRDRTVGRATGRRIHTIDREIAHLNDMNNMPNLRMQRLMDIRERFTNLLSKLTKPQALEAVRFIEAHRDRAHYLPGKIEEINIAHHHPRGTVNYRKLPDATHQALIDHLHTPISRQFYHLGVHLPIVSVRKGRKV